MWTWSRCVTCCATAWARRAAWAVAGVLTLWVLGWLAVPPLRARAQLLVDGVAVFVGSVQAVTLAEVATLALEG